MVVLHIPQKLGTNSTMQRELRGYVPLAPWFPIKQLLFACNGGTGLFSQFQAVVLNSAFALFLVFLQQSMGVFFTLFFPCTERDQTLTQRMAELSQSLGVCGGPESLLPIPVLHGTQRDVSVLFLHKTKILYALVLYGANMSRKKRVHLHHKPCGY